MLYRLYSQIFNYLFAARLLVETPATKMYGCRAFITDKKYSFKCSAVNALHGISFTTSLYEQEIDQIKKARTDFPVII